jgi:hypothetical protein
LAVAAAPALAVPPGPAPLPLVVDASVVRSGEVGFEGSGQLLSGTEVRAGPAGGATGSLALVSQTSVPVQLTVQDVGPPIGEEEHLWVRIALDGTAVFDGPRSALRSTTSSPLTVAPGGRAQLHVWVGLRPGAPAVFQGRRVELRLQIASPAADATAPGSTAGR